ncbi:MAG: CDP-diacylglycerol--glycerol-3-phosphate 3-phosphatidyltransferase [Clostridia bacterium]|nr:CDP-diacylglycerol--glycerol-3-phosphate 3-phosphatidyltransferase [Clostridia bacterium]
MNTPNKLTIFRIILTPIFLAALLIQFPQHYLVATILFIIASVTDLIDGKMARKYNLITTLGKLLDPLADKVLVTAALLAFIKLGLCDVWAVMIILAREFLITSIRMVATTQGVVIPANIYGKVKTVLQMVAIITILSLSWLTGLLADFNVLPVFISQNIWILYEVLIWAATLMTIISGVIYIKDTRKVVDFSK